MSKSPTRLQAGDEFGAVGIATRMRRDSARRRLPPGRRATPRSASTPMPANSRTTASTSSRVASTQVRWAAGVEARFRQDALDRARGALARRAAGAIGHRDEFGLAAARAASPSPRAAPPSRRSSAGRTRRKRVILSPISGRREKRNWFIRRSPSTRSRGVGNQQAAVAAEPQLDGQLGLGCRRAARNPALSSRSRPASANHSAICRSEKPSRRCACSSRRNSSACGAKSTITSRPAGRSSRAASRIASGRIVEIVQHLVHGHQIEGVALDRRRVDVALAHLRIG